MNTSNILAFVTVLLACSNCALLCQRPGESIKLDVAAKIVAGIYEVENKERGSSTALNTIIVSTIEEDNLDRVHRFSCYLSQLHMKALVVTFDELPYKVLCNTLARNASYAGTFIPFMWVTERREIRFVPSSNSTPDIRDQTDVGTNRHHIFDYGKKLKLVLALMELGYDVLYADVNTVFLRDPFSNIFRYHHGSFMYAVERPCGFKK